MKTADEYRALYPEASAEEVAAAEKLERIYQALPSDEHRRNYLRILRKWIARPHLERESK